MCAAMKKSALRAMHRPVHNGDAFSRLHPKMPRADRARIFLPFDALSGFDDAMNAETVRTVHPAELSEEMKQELDDRFAALLAQYRKLPAGRYTRRGKLPVSILYFEIDPAQTALHSDGIRGNYRWLSGDILDIDPVGRSINLGGQTLEMDRIYAIARPPQESGN